MWQRKWLPRELSGIVLRNCEESLYKKKIPYWIFNKAGKYFSSRAVILLLSITDKGQLSAKWKTLLFISLLSCGFYVFNVPVHLNPLEDYQTPTRIPLFLFSFFNLSLCGYSLDLGRGAFCAYWLFQCWCLSRLANTNLKTKTQNFFPVVSRLILAISFLDNTKTNTEFDFVSYQLAALIVCAAVCAKLDKQKG